MRGFDLKVQVKSKATPNLDLESALRQGKEVNSDGKEDIDSKEVISDILIKEEPISL